MTEIATHIHQLVTLVARHPGNRETLLTRDFLAVAVVLDRREWLKECSMTMLGAVDRLGPDWAAAALQVQRTFGSDRKDYLR